MKLIIGLGNPGSEYESTRHNVGWMALDRLAKKFECSEFREEKKFFGSISTGKIDREKIVLVKPTTYMNNSGQSVRSLIDFYKLVPADIIVVHDDKDIPLGTLRAQTDRGPAGHNGVKSIIEHLGTKDFYRIRIGIAPNEPEKMGVTSHFVLHNFTAEEQLALKPVLENVMAEIEKIIRSHQNEQ